MEEGRHKEGVEGACCGIPVVLSTGVGRLGCENASVAVTPELKKRKVQAVSIRKPKQKITIINEVLSCE